MATATLGIQTSDTANTTSYPSGSFTPAAGDLLVVCVHAAGTDPAANSGALSDSQSLGWTKLDERVFGGSGAMYLFRANARAAASSMTVTFSCPGDAATGVNITVGRFNGSALTEVQWNFKIGSSGVAPNVVMSAAINTANAVMGIVGSLTNPPGLTAPSGWSASAESGFSTPDRGHSFSKKDSGVTLTTVTWGSTSGSTWGAYVIEFATSIDGNATGTLPTVTATAVAATGSGSAGATGSAPTVTVTAAAGSGSGAAGATGTLPTITLAASTGAASGGAGAAGSLPTVTLSAIAGTGSGAAGALGTLPTVTVSSLAASAAADAGASGALVTITTTAAAAAGSGGAGASGNLVTVVVSAATGSASGGGSSVDGNATGDLPTVTVSSAAGAGSGGASIGAGLPTITLSSVAGMAAGDALALGAWTTVSVVPCAGSASGGGSNPTGRPLRGPTFILPMLQGRV